MRGILSFAALLLVWGSQAADLAPVPGVGVRIQPGFRVGVYAGSDLADNVHAMAVDSMGRVVVSGPGYIRTLEDPLGKGVAGGFKQYATPVGSAEGLCFDGPALFASVDGWVARFEDMDGDGQADRPPLNLFAIGQGEAGGHGIRKGPDGFLYLIGGCGSISPTAPISHQGFPVRLPEGGVFLRFSGDGSDIQVIAHGLRNPFGFDFDSAGEPFTVDSGSARDNWLPWHASARLLNLTPGSHFGWRLNTISRGWPRPAEYADCAGWHLELENIEARGVVCYQHFQFPQHFRNGFFVLDWESGRIFYISMNGIEEGYDPQMEVFLEPLDARGMTPTAIAVGRGGELYVSYGGRNTPGMVLRIDYNGPPLMDEVQPPVPNLDVNWVLTRPQPLEAWSRADWRPVAEAQGASVFLRTAIEESFTPVMRMRAIEILTEMYRGLPPTTADTLARSSSPRVRARTAWSLSRFPGPNPSLMLFPMMTDESALVRRHALDAAAAIVQTLDSPELVRLTIQNLSHPDKSVRQAAARLASRFSAAAWEQFSDQVADSDYGTVLSGMMAELWRWPTGRETLERLALIIQNVPEPLLKRDALRLVMLSQGDWNLQKPAVEAFGGYEFFVPETRKQDALQRIRKSVRAILPSGNAYLDAEAARLLAMFQENDVRSASHLISGITASSPVEADFHKLLCFARMRSWPEEMTPRVAAAILQMNRKAGPMAWSPAVNYSRRLEELMRELLKRQPALARAIIQNPEFTAPAQVRLAAMLGAENQAAAARRFMDAASKSSKFPWTPPLVALLANLPIEERRPLFRAQYTNVVVRDVILMQLAAQPEIADMDRLSQGLDSPALDVARACVLGLLQLPKSPEIKAAGMRLTYAFCLLRRLMDEPGEAALRGQVLEWISRLSGEEFKVSEPAAPRLVTVDYMADVRAAWDPVLKAVARKHSQLTGVLADMPDPVRWKGVLHETAWEKGNELNGAQVFETRQCAVCHGEPQPVGPSLKGVAVRLKPEEVFARILYPAHDKSFAAASPAARWRSTSFLMQDGGVASGVVAWQSLDAVIVHTSAVESERLDPEQILDQRPACVSFMPGNLIENLAPQALADLMAYLKSL